MKISVNNDIKLSSFENDMKYLKKEIEEIKERQQDFCRTSDACCPHLDSIAYDLNHDSIDWSVEYGRNYSRWHAGYIVLPPEMYSRYVYDYEPYVDVDMLTKDGIRNWLRNEVRSIGVNYFNGNYDTWARFVD